MFEIKNTKKIPFILFVLFLFLVPAYAKGKMIPVDSQWEYICGDDPDGSWADIDMPSNVSGDEDGFFWLQTEVEIPSEMEGEEIFLELGCSTASLEIFVDGILMGRHGTIEPQAHVSHVSNTVVTIPQSAIDNGEMEIQIRGKNNSSATIFSQFYFVDKARFISTTIYQPLLNTTVYYMMAAVCLFLGLYFLAQFFSDRKDKSNLSFALTLAFAAIYFFDMASDIVLFYFPLQLAFSRLCLLFSVCFLTTFLIQKFGIKTKIPNVILAAVMILFTVLYIASCRNALFQEILFTLSLIPIFSCIIFIYVILVKAARKHMANANIMLIGISLGMLFGVHDIIYQAMGAVPFAWLQGFAFFFIDITMFIVVSIEAITNKKTISNYVTQTSAQNERMDTLIRQAAELSTETSEIAKELHESVSSVAVGAAESADKAMRIGNYIAKQNEAVRSTSNALEKLVDSVKTVKKEVQIENEVVDTTISETKSLVNGAKQVANAVDTTSVFAKTLGALTEKSSNEVNSLVDIMESIKKASAEIIKVVGVVTDFAHKTNMLAMNASIEAAHSGAAGKGFSVIAHEIKKLAEASNNQAERISDIVTQINTSINEGFNLSINVRKALEQVAQEAADTSEKIELTVQGMAAQRESGERITKATETMNYSSEKVSGETDQQYGFSQQVSENMMELSEIASMTEDAAGEIMSKNNELSEEAKALQALAERAREAADGLNKLINN